MKKWSELYNVHSLSLAKGTIRVVVNWTSGGYAISFNRTHLKKRITNLDEAKAAGLRLVERLITLASKEIEEIRDNS